MQLITKKMTMKNDLIITFLNGIVVLLSVFVLNALIARMYGLEILGEFSYIRRIAVSIISVLLFGMNIGLPYYLSREENTNYAYSAGIIFIIFSTPLILLTSWLISRGIIPGLESNKILIYFSYIMGIGMQFLTYGLYRGHMNMIGANILQLICTAIVPIFAFIYFDGLENTLLVIGLSTYIISLIGFIYRIKSGYEILGIVKNAVVLVKYGIVRLPSFLSQFLLIAGLPIMVSSQITLSDMAFLNAGISLVRLALVFVMPLGMILLPRISHAFAKGKQKEVGKGMSSLILTTIYFSTVVCCVVYFYAGELLTLWLGDITTEGVSIVKMVILAFPFYSIMGVLRGPIDASSEKGYNSIIYVSSAVAMLVCYYLLMVANINPLLSGIVAFVFGHIVSTFASLILSKKLFNLSIKFVKTFIQVIFTILILKSMELSIGLIVESPILRLGIFLMSLSIVFFTYINYSTSTWVTEFKKRIIS